MNASQGAFEWNGCDESTHVDPKSHLLRLVGTHVVQWAPGYVAFMARMMTWGSELTAQDVYGKTETVVEEDMLIV